MRFTLPDMDISLNVSVSSLLYDSSATTTIALEDLMLFLRNDNKYSSVFKPLISFDCRGRSIMEDWVRHVSVYEHNFATYPYRNKTNIISQLANEYSSKLLLKTTSIPSLRKMLREELYANRRCSFKTGDMLLYRTTISPVSGSIPSKRYLMQVIIA
jgi:hypothetical protein